MLLMPSSLFPPFFQRPRYQAVSRLHTRILARCALHRVACALQPLLPMPLEWGSFGSHGLGGRATQCSGRRGEDLPHLLGNKVGQHRPGQAQTPRGAITHGGLHTRGAPPVRLATLRGQ
jgi:hypothetical protein